jgi:hypothetical protein
MALAEPDRYQGAEGEIMPTLIALTPAATAAIIVVVVVIVCALVLFALLGRRQRLHTKFGPEYDRTVEKLGWYKGERELHQRAKRVEQLHIRPLSESDRERFTADWLAVQREFVDNPDRSLVHADELLGEVMAVRGYPMRDFEQRAEDISVNHPRVVENYRAAHSVTLAQAHGEATTEEIRRAIIHYRALFDELVPATHVPEYASTEPRAR